MLKGNEVRAQSHQLLINGNLIGVDGALGQQAVFIHRDHGVGQHRADLFLKAVAVGDDVIRGERFNGVHAGHNVLHLGAQVGFNACTLGAACVKEAVGCNGQHLQKVLPVLFHVLLGLFDLEDFGVAGNGHHADVIL